MAKLTMNRDLARLAGQTYDLIVIGGGITGANIAWDAALRGLRVVLLEKQDFGAATSANSLKTVHGGLRYLQDGNLRLVRKMIRERQALLRIAPHLVHPLPVLMPTLRNKLMRGRLALGTAIKLNDLVSLDRNSGMDTAHVLPSGQVLSRRAALDLLPGLEDVDISGAVLWHDAQINNTERLVLAIVQSAVSAGAEVANYANVTGFLRSGNHLTGVKVSDELTGQLVQVRAHQVVNAAGPWVDQLLDDLMLPESTPRFRLSTAMNLVTRQIVSDYAVGLSSTYMHSAADGTVEERSRVLFVAPWRNYSIVGTLHAPYDGHPDDSWSNESAILDFVHEVNQAYPGAHLRREDIFRVHRGYLPMIPNDADPMTVKLLREGQITDHAHEHGIEGLITVVGVKYTTGRYLAEQVVDLVFDKLQRLSPLCQTRRRPVFGGDIDRYAAYSSTDLDQWPSEMPSHQLQRLWRSYGSVMGQLLAYIRQDDKMADLIAKDTDVTRAEIIHAVRAEMACKLGDVIFRRTEMGMAQQPSHDCIVACAQLMATELAWTGSRVEQEIEETMNECDQTFMQPYGGNENGNGSCVAHEISTAA